MLGVAVSTARPAVGGLAPYVKFGVGAISTQAMLNAYYGIDGLTYLAEGMSPEEALEKLKAADDNQEIRQVAMVNTAGQTAAFTGSQAVPWAGHYVGDQFVVAGNTLVGEETVQAMVNSFESTESGYLPERLLAVLKAGQEAGGDKRGKQSAALYVVHDMEYPLVDIRSDEHADPVTELHRIYEVCKTDLFPYIANMPRRHR